MNDNIENAENMEEDVNPALLDFKNFLRRRKVYLYINEERYLRAERMCHEMLEEKENENFAIDELAYIQQIRRARGEDFNTSDPDIESKPQADKEPPSAPL